MLVKCAADELGEHGIRVNAVQPGIVDTELMSFMFGVPRTSVWLRSFCSQWSVIRVLVGVNTPETGNL